MEYVEFLRVRRTLLWYSGILALIVLVILTLPQVGTINVHGAGSSTRFAPGAGAPLSALATLAGFFAAIYATIVGASLNRESETRDLSWTKPLSRTLLAVRYMLLDLAGVLVAFSVALGGAAIVATYMHFPPVFDPQAGTQLVLAFGVGAMWYGLLQALTCAFRSGARAMNGILWPVALAIGGLSHLPGPLGAVLRLVDLINPLHYLGMTTSDGPMSAEQTLGYPMPADERALIVWCLALGFCAIAVYVWPRREA